MEDYGYKYIQKMFQFVTTLNSTKLAPLIWYQRLSGISTFSILYWKLLRENKNPKFQTGYRVRISQNDFPLTMVVNHSLQRKFLRLLQFLPEILQHTQ